MEKTQKIIRYTLFSCLCLLNYSLFSQAVFTDCGQPIECPQNRFYPYKVCDIEAKEVKTICLAGDWSGKEYVNAGLKLRKAKLPICIGSTASGPTIYTHVEGDMEVYANGVRVLSHEKTLQEFQDACDQWNCLCSEVDENNGWGQCPSPINLYFTQNPRDFDFYKPEEEGGKPWQITSVLAQTQGKEEDGGCDMRYNDGDFDYSAKIVFNFTNELLYDTEYPTSSDKQVFAFVNEDYADYAASALPKVELRYFSYTALHEIGHALGFGHYYDVDDRGRVVFSCEKDNSGIILSGIMDSEAKDDPHKDLLPGLSQDDKCMFVKLYCGDLVTVDINEHEYNSDENNLYPNPSYYEAKLEFDIEAEYDVVTIKIQNNLGEIVLMPIENKEYTQGSHLELINVQILPNGYYYCIIQTQRKSYVRPFVVIR